jgi:hypothetical protein
VLLSIDWAGQAIIRPSHVRGVQAVISEGTSVAVIVTFAKRERQRPRGVSTNRTAEKYEKRNSGTVSHSRSGSNRISRRTHDWPLARACISLCHALHISHGPMIFNSHAPVLEIPNPSSMRKELSLSLSAEHEHPPRRRFEHLGHVTVGPGFDNGTARRIEILDRQDERAGRMAVGRTAHRRR